MTTKPLKRNTGQINMATWHKNKDEVVIEGKLEDFERLAAMSVIIEIWRF